MAELVTPAQVLDFLGLEAGDEGDEVALSLAVQIEALLVSQCRRTERPFQTAQAARTEVKDGNGSATLILDYAISALTSVKLGYDVGAPDETLVVNDQTKLVHRVGVARLVRVDGGSFGTLGKPNYVHVTYDAQEDLPEHAGMAVLRGVAVVWGQRGSEDASSQSVGGFSADLVAAIESDPIWKMVVNSQRRLVFA